VDGKSDLGRCFLDCRRHCRDHAGWSITTATYFAFSNDVIKGVIARQTEQQYAYEDRIAELRAQIDRTTAASFLTRAVRAEAR